MSPALITVLWPQRELHYFPSFSVPRPTFISRPFCSCTFNWTGGHDGPAGKPQLHLEKKTRQGGEEGHSQRHIRAFLTSEPRCYSSNLLQLYTVSVSVSTSGLISWAPRCLIFQAKLYGLIDSQRKETPSQWSATKRLSGPRGLHFFFLLWLQLYF